MALGLKASVVIRPPLMSIAVIASSIQAGDCLEGPRVQRHHVLILEKRLHADGSTAGSGL